MKAPKPQNNPCETGSRPKNLNFSKFWRKILTPMLTNPQHVKFCHALMLGLPPKQAAREAGLASYRNVMRRPDIKAYLVELQADARKKYEIDRDDVAKMFMEAAEMARALEDPQALIAAAREIGKLLGHYEPEERRITLSVDQTKRKQELEMLDESKLLDLAGTDVVDAEFKLIEGEALQ